MGKQQNQWQTFFSWAPKSLWTVTIAMKLKDTCSLEENDKPRKHIKKQRCYFADKVMSSQSYGLVFPVVMYGCERWSVEGWALKNWCFWTVVLEKTLESLLDCKEIKPVHPKGNQSWIFFGRTDAEAEAPILRPPEVKCWLIGKDPVLGKTEGRRRRGWQRRWLDVITDLMDRAPRDGEGQGNLACCSPWGHKESDTTEWLNNNNNALKSEFLSAQI